MPKMHTTDVTQELMAEVERLAKKHGITKEEILRRAAASLSTPTSLKTKKEGNKST